MARLERGLGQLQAIALNMSNMVGVGPFITIPLIIGTMGGPQCMLGWVLGAILALCDGLVWSELSAAMPSTGGTYVYLREAFRGTALGHFLPESARGDEAPPRLVPDRGPSGRMVPETTKHFLHLGPHGSRPDCD